MTEDQIVNGVLGCVRDILSLPGDANIDLNEDFGGRDEWDSVHHILIVLELERVFGTKIPEDIALSTFSISDLANYLRSNPA